MSQVNYFANDINRILSASVNACTWVNNALRFETEEGVFETTIPDATTTSKGLMSAQSYQLLYSLKSQLQSTNAIPTDADVEQGDNEVTLDFRSGGVSAFAATIPAATENEAGVMSMSAYRRLMQSQIVYRVEAISTTPEIQIGGHVVKPTDIVKLVYCDALGLLLLKVGINTYYSTWSGDYNANGDADYKTDGVLIRTQAGTYQWNADAERYEAAFGSGLSEDELAKLKSLISLGISIDTTNDLLTIGGKRYKLTEYVERNPDYIIYGEWTIGSINGLPSTIPTDGGIYTLSAKASRTRTQHYTDGTTNVLPNETVTITEFAVVSGNATIRNSSLSVPATTTGQSITIRATYEGKTKDNTIQQAAPATYAYYGFSTSEPTSPTSGTQVELTGSTSIEIGTTSTDKAYYHWVAFPTSSGASVTAWKDEDNDSMLDITQTKVVGSHTIRYLKSSRYISNTSKITITG